MNLHIDSSSWNSSKLHVTFTHGAVPGIATLNVYAVLADDLDRSSVLRGENSGRTLQHASVARVLTQVAKVQAEGQTTVDIPVPPNFVLGKGGHHLILFAQAEHYGPVLGTAVRPL